MADNELYNHTPKIENTANITNTTNITNITNDTATQIHTRKVIQLYSVKPTKSSPSRGLYSSCLYRNQ